MNTDQDFYAYYCDDPNLLERWDQLNRVHANNWEKARQFCQKHGGIPAFNNRGKFSAVVFNGDLPTRENLGECKKPYLWTASSSAGRWPRTRVLKKHCPNHLSKDEIDNLKKELAIDWEEAQTIQPVNTSDLCSLVGIHEIQLIIGGYKIFKVSGRIVLKTREKIQSQSLKPMSQLAYMVEEGAYAAKTPTTTTIHGHGWTNPKDHI